MFAWLNPLALAGLLAAVAPVVVHLLRSRQAPRVPFPTTRFVRAASTTAVRPASPSDVVLLALRVAIVAGAAGALAQPLFVTSGRRESWNQRVLRAMVIDRSPSMAPVAARATTAADAEARSGSVAVRIERSALREGLREAVGALEPLPPGRREIVLVSDFQEGSIDAADLAAVPAAIGLRFVNVGAPRTPPSFTGTETLAAPGIPARVPQVQLSSSGTLVRFTAEERRQAGLRLIGAGTAAEPLLRAVARAGAPAPSAGQPVAVIFSLERPQAARDDRPEGSRAMPAWMTRAVLGMSRDRLLAEAALEHTGGATLDPALGHVVARSARGQPVVVAAASGPQLEVRVAGSPHDFLAVAALRAALFGRYGDPDLAEHNPTVISTAALERWARPPGRVGQSDLGGSSAIAPGDASLVWAAVLVLLGVETIARRRRREAPVNHANAA